MWNRKTVLLFLAVLLVGSVMGQPGGPAGAAPQEDPPQETLLENGFRVTFDGVEYHEDGTSNWFYTLEETESAKDLSNWVLETPFCAPILDAGPEPWEIVDPDPNAQLSGVKWETGDGFQVGQFWVKLDTSGQVGLTHVAAKGPDVAYGEIAGPTCVDEQPPEEPPPPDPDDQVPPSIDWVAPVGNGETYEVQDGETVELVADASDDVAVDRVIFQRWDAVSEVFVVIAVDNQAPYEAVVTTGELNPTWNEVQAGSLDAAGNFSGWKWIWLYLPQDGPLFGTQEITFYMPMLMR